MYKSRKFDPVLILLVVVFVVTGLYSLHVSDSEHPLVRSGFTGNNPEKESGIIEVTENPKEQDISGVQWPVSVLSETTVQTETEDSNAFDSIAAVSIESTATSAIDSQASEDDYIVYSNEFALIEIGFDTEFDILQSRFDDWLSSTPGALMTLFDFYYNNNNVDTGSLLQTLLRFTNNQDLTAEIVDQIYQSTGRDAGVWVEILKHAGATSAQSQLSVLHLLPYLDGQHNQINALVSLRREAGESLDASSILEELTVYLEHDDASMVSTAIEVLGGWSNEDNLHVFESALQTQDHQIRTSTIRTISQHEIRSRNLRQALLNIMSDQENRIDTRVDAYYALQRFPADSNEETQIRNFYFTFLHNN